MAMSIDLDSDGSMDDIIEAVDSFDFTRPGEEQSLGRDLVTVAVMGRPGRRDNPNEGIWRRSHDALDPSGTPWKPNSDTPFHGIPGYATYKMKRYNVDKPGELGGQMLSKLALEGRPEISPDHVRMVYGWGLPPDKRTARSGAAMKPRELVATDRQKAEWFEAGGRTFYEFDEQIEEALADTAEESIANHFRERGYTVT